MNAREAFERCVREHFSYPPDTWTVEKIRDRSWCTVRPDGVRLDRFETKRAATDGLSTGLLAKTWRETDAWYRETTRDSRMRQLVDWERAIIAQHLV
jgi:hypothetical protein